jgi:phage anti-repressor protein
LSPLFQFKVEKCNTWGRQQYLAPVARGFHEVEPDFLEFETHWQEVFEEQEFLKFQQQPDSLVVLEKESVGQEDGL